MRVVAIFELATYLANKGVTHTIGMNIGGTVCLPGIAVSMGKAKHSSSIQDADRVVYLGDAAGFILTIESDPVLYHAGDTAVFGDMSLIRELYASEVAMLPIGGHFTMAPREAAVAIRPLQPKLVLPLHRGTFPQLTGTPQELAAMLSDPLIVSIVEPENAI